MFLFFFVMIRRPPRSTRTDTLFPYTTLFRSVARAERARNYSVIIVSVMTVVPSRAKRPPSQTWSFAMIALQSKSAFLYKQIRRALRSGRYVPGERLDPATIAEEFHTRATPVRFAFYRRSEERRVGEECGRCG